jgi:hypothetical protein
VPAGLPLPAACFFESMPRMADVTVASPTTIPAAIDEIARVVAPV